MKTSTGKFLLAAAVAWTTLPLASFAQMGHDRPGAAGRDLQRLTLLTGPDLLSPSRPAPPMLFKHTTALGAALDLGTVPSSPPVPRFLSGGQGSLRLLERKTIKPFSPSGILADPAPKNPRPTPESLRFDATLHSPAR